jgi:hypothetical protein
MRVAAWQSWSLNRTAPAPVLYVHGLTVRLDATDSPNGDATF